MLKRPGKVSPFNTTRHKYSIVSVHCLPHELVPLGAELALILPVVDARKDWRAIALPHQPIVLGRSVSLVLPW